MDPVYALTDRALLIPTIVARMATCASGIQCNGGVRLHVEQGGLA